MDELDRAIAFLNTYNKQTWDNAALTITLILTFGGILFGVVFPWLMRRVQEQAFDALLEKQKAAYQTELQQLKEQLTEQNHKEQAELAAKLTKDYQTQLNEAQQDLQDDLTDFKIENYYNMAADQARNKQYGHVLIWQLRAIEEYFKLSVARQKKIVFLIKILIFLK